MFGSLTLDETLAWFVIEPVDCGVTLIWTLALAPFAIVPERAGDGAGRLRAAALRRRGRVERHAGGQRVAHGHAGRARGPGVLDADRVGELLADQHRIRASPSSSPTRSATGLTVVVALAELLARIGVDRRRR